MDLDKIKESWKKVDDVSKAKTLAGSMLTEILNKENKSALGKMIFFERFRAFLAICLIAMMYIYSVHFFNSFAGKIFCYSGMLAFSILLVWQIFKYRFLRKIKFSTMSITEVASRMLEYQQFFKKETKGTNLFIVGFLIGLFSLFYQKVAEISEDPLSLQFKIIFFASSILFCFLGFRMKQIIRKKWYWNNIEEIQKNVKELEIFKQD